MLDICPQLFHVLSANRKAKSSIDMCSAVHGGVLSNHVESSLILIHASYCITDACSDVCLIISPSSLLLCVVEATTVFQLTVTSIQCIEIRQKYLVVTYDEM